MQHAYGFALEFSLSKQWLNSKITDNGVAFLTWIFVGTLIGILNEKLDFGPHVFSVPSMRENDAIYQTASCKPFPKP